MSPTKQRLIQTAVELFGRHGFHAVGLDRVIDEVGVSKQTFYNHFESKDDLVLAVLAQRHEADGAILAKLLDAAAGPDPRARLYALFDAMDARFALPDWRGCLFMTAAAEFPSPHDPAHVAARSHFDGFEAHLRDLAARAGAADPVALASRLSLLVEGAIVYRHVRGDGDRATAIARTMARVALDQAFAAPVVAS